MPKVFVENSEVSKCFANGIQPQQLFEEGVEVSRRALGENPEMDEVHIVSQTFKEHFMSDVGERFAHVLGIDANLVEVHKIYSNSQPIIQKCFEAVKESRKRILILGIEGLRLFQDVEKRSKIIGEALGKDADRFETMPNAVGFLSKKLLNYFGFSRQQVALFFGGGGN